MTIADTYVNSAPIPKGAIWTKQGPIPQSKEVFVFVPQMVLFAADFFGCSSIRLKSAVTASARAARQASRENTRR